MTREEFLSWLEQALADRGVPCRRYMVGPGLEDLEIRIDGVVHRLRTVRTAPSATRRPAVTVDTLEEPRSI